MKGMPWWTGPLLLLAGAVLGCGGAQPSTQGLHRDCSGGVACASGQSCLQYTGLAGQPLFSCEIRCTYQADCPAPLDCVIISDGPNERVCN